jgi:CMP/dCMP kinase
LAKLKKSNVIAIDGPSGSGKSTMAQNLAKELKVLFIDTGAMYRALGLRAKQLSIDLSSPEQVENFLKNIQIDYGPDEEILIRIDGEDFSQKIREHEVSFLASQISKVNAIRVFLVDFQRGLTKQKVCVMEGRDIGTVVFPDAFCKIFITASVDVRAKRRLEQLQESGDCDLDFRDIIHDVKERDESDRNRKVSPLYQAEDAFLLDTSELSEPQVLQSLISQVKGKAKEWDVKLP